MAPATLYLAFAAYLVAMALIGWAAWRRTQGISDYLLGGRRLGAGTAALSAGASDMSGWLLLGLPGLAYTSGLQSLWLAGGLLLGTWLNWRLIAPRLRVHSELTAALTLPEFLAHRFGDPGGLLRTLAALFILLFFLIYTASGLVAGGRLFQSVFGLDYSWAVAAGVAAILLYTLVGGFLAVSWTDVVQGLLMLAALVAVPLAALDGPTLRQLAEVHPQLLDPFRDAQGHALGGIALASLAAWGLGYFGQPHILARFKAIRSLGHIPRARRIALTWVTLTLAGAIAAGLAGVPLFDPPLSGADTEKVFIRLVPLLFHPLIAGICLAAVLAAIMSTADSQLLVASSALSEDLYRHFLRRDPRPGELVRAGRLAVAGVAFAAFGLALDPASHVLDLVGYAWAGFGATFGPVLLLALHWRRTTRAGAIAGMLTGGLTVIAWRHLQGDWFDLYEILPGFLAATLATIALSLVTRPPADACLAAFDQACGQVRNARAKP